MNCFRDDDKGYMQWVKTNLNGFVVNTPRQPDPNYLMLHRATCHTITGTPPNGKNWTEAWIKICSLDRMELDNCVTLLLSGNLMLCDKCKP